MGNELTQKEAQAMIISHLTVSQRAIISQNPALAYAFIRDLVSAMLSTWFDDDHDEVDSLVKDVIARRSDNVLLREVCDTAVTPKIEHSAVEDYINTLDFSDIFEEEDEDDDAEDWTTADPIT